MISQLKELFSILEPRQKKKFLTLQIMVVFMAFTEILGVASIGPFMALVGDGTLLERENLLSGFYQWAGFATQNHFLVFLGLIVFTLLTVSAVVSIVTTWKLSHFATKLGAEIADRLYSHYLRQGWLFHASSSSAQLTKQITTESNRLTYGVLLPFMTLNARSVFAVVLAGGLLIFDPWVALMGLLIFGCGYLLIYKLIKKLLGSNGVAISNLNGLRYSLIGQGLGGIKEVILLGREKGFIDKFEEVNQKLAYAEGTNQALGSVPRFLIELIAFSAMIFLVIYLLLNYEGELSKVLPVLSIYALAGYKLLPAFQNVYVSIATIRGNIGAFESIRQDLLDSSTRKTCNKNSKQLYLSPKYCISLKNISFTYPGKTKKSLNNLTMNIPAKSVIGIVGSSGSGKSTAIDVLLGLIQPQIGSIEIDDQLLTQSNIRAWQNTVGFVPQSIFLSEGTIAENVAFGVPENEIDFTQVEKALTLAHLNELVKSLDKGVYTRIGERGVQLSGGQRQRIGIARALYQKADVLVFDEATSALDGITEKMIMEAIHDFSGEKTIIMVAHRLKTVELCDTIFFFDKGRLVDSGTYEELIEKNHLFKKMAGHS